MPSPTPLRVIVADRHGLMIDGIRVALEAAPDIQIVGQAVDEDELLALAGSVQADVVLIDPLISPGSGMACLDSLREIPGLDIIVLSDAEGLAHVESALAHGAAGYVMKSIDPRDLASAIRQVAHGTVHHPHPGGDRAFEGQSPWGLNARERAIVNLLVEGLSNVEIGRCLYISDHTVKYYLRRLYRKLGVANRTQVASAALRPQAGTTALRLLPGAGARSAEGPVRREHAAARRRAGVAAAARPPERAGAHPQPAAAVARGRS